MAWLKIYQSIRQHRKILDAADALEIAPPYMIGLLTSFWLWALDNAPDGNVSEISARNIARAAQWDGDADELLQAFISAGLLDQGDEDPATLTIHDWEEYAGTLIQQREAEKERSRRRRAAAKKTEGRPPDDQQATAGRVDKTRVDKTRDIKDPLSAPPEHEAATPAKSDPTPYVKIMQLYNEICVSFSKIQKIDGARRKAVAARFKTYPNIETFETLFRKTEAMGTMTVPIVGLLENMELSITKIGEDKGLGKMSKLDKHSFEFRWVQNVVKADGSTSPEGCKAFVRTFPPTALPGIGAEIGSASENELTYTANRVQIFVGGYEYLLVDRLSQILRIDGKDYMSDINKLL